MAVLRGILGYLAAILVALLMFWGWQMKVFTKPWPVQLVWVQMSIITLPFALVMTAVPAFVMRMIAAKYRWFDRLTAGSAGATTGLIAYLFISNFDDTPGRPVFALGIELIAFAALGVIAGLVWFWVENVGANKE